MLDQGSLKRRVTALAASIISRKPLIEAVGPHRAELSDMHAFVVHGPNRSVRTYDHDRWDDTLNHHDAPSIRAWLKT